MSDPAALRALARWLCCGHRTDGCVDEARHYRPPGECEGLDLVNAMPGQLDLADAVAAAVREQVARDIESEREKITIQLHKEMEMYVADQLAGERIGLNRAAAIAREVNHG